MLEVLSISFHTRAAVHACTGRLFCRWHAAADQPFSNQAPLQINNFEYGRAVDIHSIYRRHALAWQHDSPDLIVHWIQVGTIRWPQFVVWARSKVPRCHECCELARCQAASIYKVQYEQIRRSVVGGVYVFVLNSLRCVAAKNGQNQMISDEDITKRTRSSATAEKQRVKKEWRLFLSHSIVTDWDGQINDGKSHAAYHSTLVLYELLA